MSTPIMTAKQGQKLRQLEDELHVPHGTLPILDVRKGYVFTQVEGVTVLITRRSRNPNGGFIVPSLHTYTETVNPTNLNAAVDARRLYESQTRNLRNGAYTYDYGHLGPIIGADWRCMERACPCNNNNEDEAQREKRSIGHPIRSTA